MRILATLSLGLFASLAAASCVADVAEYPSESDMPPQFSEAAMVNGRQTAFNYFVSKGLTEVQSAGIVGNLVQESSVSPTAVEYGGGPGRGIAQWGVGGRWDSSSGDNVASFAAKQGTSRWALNTQLDFIWFELQSGRYGLSQLQAATTVSSATVAFEKYYELCGTCAQTKRISDAQQVLADYGGSSGGGGGGGGGGTGSGSSGGGLTCYSGTKGMEMPQNACVQSKYDNDWYQCSAGEWVDRWSDPDACNGVYPL